MNRLFAVLIAAMMLPMPARAESACPALVITGHPDYPPVQWAAHGAIVGPIPQLVTSIAEQLGVNQVKSKDFGSWQAAQGAARRGQADVIIGIYKNDARARYLNYVEPPFMLDPVAVVVRKGDAFKFAA